MFARVVALETALLAPVALEYGGIQIQHRAERRRAQPTARRGFTRNYWRLAFMSDVSGSRA